MKVPIWDKHKQRKANEQRLKDLLLCKKKPLGTNIGEVPPASPIEGQMWFNNQTYFAYVYYQNSWVKIVNE